MFIVALQKACAFYVSKKEKVIKKIAALQHVTSNALGGVAAFFEPPIAKVYKAFTKKRITSSTPGILKHQDFYNVTRYLPSRKELLQQAESRTKEIEVLCEQLKSGAWEDIIKSYRAQPDHLAVDGLKAFQQGLIMMEQFTTLIFCWSLMHDFPGQQIQVRPLFHEDGAVNESARQAVLQTMRSSKDFPMPLEVDKRFFEKMMVQPASEQVFFLIKKDPYRENVSKEQQRQEAGAESVTIMERVSTAVGFNVFHQMKEEEQTYRMIPSLSMMQQFLYVCAPPDHAVAIAPVIGLSTTEDIANNIINNERDMGLPFPGVSLPKEADGFLVSCAMDFIGHDFYHSHRVSHTVRSLRPSYKELADIVERLQKQYPQSEGRTSLFMQELYERIIDMENPALEHNNVYMARNSAKMNINPITNGHRIMIGLRFCMEASFRKIQQKIYKETKKSSQKSSKEIQKLLEEEKNRVKDAIRLADIQGQIARELKNSGFYSRYEITEKVLKDLVRFENVNNAKIKNSLKQILQTHPDLDGLDLFDIVQFEGVSMTELDRQLTLHSSAVQQRESLAWISLALMEPRRKETPLRMA